MAFDKARTAQGLRDELEADIPAGVLTVEPAVGRVTPPSPETPPAAEVPSVPPVADDPPPIAERPGRRRRQPVRMRTTSVTFDEDLLDWLRVLVAGERGVTQRGVLRELVTRFKAAPAAERRAVLDAAYDWERETP